MVPSWLRISEFENVLCLHQVWHVGGAESQRQIGEFLFKKKTELTLCTNLCVIISMKDDQLSFIISLKVDLQINGQPVDIKMKLEPSGQSSHN